MEKEIRYDIDTDNLTKAIKELLNSYPGLEGRQVKFCMLPTETGIAFFPVTGAVIVKEKKDVLGNVYQDCIYPLMLIYRAGGLSENSKIRIKELLDNIGKWLEGKTIASEDGGYTLSIYPKVDGEKKIEYIRRSSPAYLYSQTESNVEDWVIEIRVEYKNEFQKVKK